MFGAIPNDEVLVGGVARGWMLLGMRRRAMAGGRHNLKACCDRQVIRIMERISDRAMEMGWDA